MISIIIPTYNEEKYIAESLAQFKSNLSIPYELIVTDDKSLDRTADIARSFGVAVLVPEKKHPTIAANRNAGASHANGEFLAFFDADSRIQDTDSFFKTVLQYFDDHPKVVAVTAYSRVSKKSETFTDRLIYIIFNLVHYAKNNVFHVGEAAAKFQMIRREAFEKLHGYDESLVTREDADMFQRLNSLGRTACLSNVTVFHSGRRAHKIGWPKLLYIWMTETYHVAKTGRALAKEWIDIR